MKILAAVDLSEDQTRMIKQTATWAERLYATVDLMYVSDSTDHDLKRLESLMAFMPTGLRGSCWIRQGDPGETVVAAASEYDAVIVATHGRTGVTRMLMGSVAERVIRQAPCPVLVLRLSLVG